ncbi:MAG TPA: MFS transporter, partial [Candidatus Limnocylindria bacterium]
LALMPLILLGFLPPILLVAMSALFGALDTLRMAATQAYAYDLVRTSRATSGMALTNLGVQLLTTLGGLIGGYVLDRFGSAPTFGLIAVAMLASVLGPALGGKTVAPSLESASPLPLAGVPRATGGTGPEPPARRARPDFGRAASLLLRNRLIAIVALGVVLAEILGFASQTLLPTFAHDVFDVGAAGLGTMLAVRSGGGALGLVLLAWLGADGRAGRMFVAAAALIGAMLVLFAQAPSYELALVFLALVGMCSSVMDTLGQTLMQRNAGEDERGAAMGLWVFSVGFGPIGHLTLGAAASQFGAPATQTVAGGLLAVIGLLLALNRSLRRLR